MKKCSLAQQEGRLCSLEVNITFTVQQTVRAESNACSYDWMAVCVLWFSTSCAPTATTCTCTTVVILSVLQH